MHARREQYTPNADPSRIQDNILLTNTPTVESVLQCYETKKPEKIRNDQVRAIEVLVTASPEAMAEMSEEQRLNYLKDALNFANAEFGGENNLLHAEIHNDETTAHLTAFYIPLVTKKNSRSGKEKTGLNAKELMGNKQDYSERQTRFHNQVSSKYGLERGEIGSKAEHTTIRDWYRQANQIKSFEEIDFKKLDKQIKHTVEVSKKGFLGDKTEEVKVTPYLEVKTLNEAFKPLFELRNKNKFFGTKKQKRDDERRKKQIKDEIEQKSRELELKHQKKMAQLDAQARELKAKQIELNETETNLKEILEKQISQQEELKWKWVSDFFVDVWNRFFKYENEKNYHERSPLTYQKVKEEINNALSEHYNLKKEIKGLKETLESTKTDLEILKSEKKSLQDKLNSPRYIKELHEKYEHQAEQEKIMEQQRSSGMRMGR